MLRDYYLYNYSPPPDFAAFSVMTVIYVFKIALAVGPVTHAVHFHSGLMSRRSKALLAGVSSPVPS